MSKQYLLIHNFPALYEILNELKNTLSFKIKKVQTNEEFEKKKRFKLSYNF